MHPFIKQKFLKALLLLSLFCPLARADDGRTRFIVSDVDDTIKMTHVLDPAGSVMRELFSRRAFAGMSTLYNELSRNNSFNSSLNETAAPTVHYVSGGLSFQKIFVRAFLKKNQFPNSTNINLRPSTSEPTHDFKVRMISQLMQSNPTATATCIGDDGEKDPETYRDLKATFADRITAVYIHRIQGREIYEGQTAYDTAMDIALYEVTRGHLSVEQAQRVGDSIVADGTANLILDESYCPAQTALRVSDQLTAQIHSPTLLSLARSIEDQTRLSCAKAKKI